MTVAELYNQVAQLGFEDSIEDDGRFYNAANRAILQVNAIRPAIAHCVLNHKPLKNLISKSVFTPIEVDGELVFEAIAAKSYYFEADGNGDLYIEQQNEDGIWNTDNPLVHISLASSGHTFVAYKGFIKDGGAFVEGTVRLRFAGDYSYSVKNVALYDKLYSAETADIPEFSAQTRYDIAAMVDDFMVLCCPPIKQDETNTILNQEYEVEGNSVILLPYNQKGLFKVLYQRQPRKLVSENSAQDDQTEIDLDAELCSLLPLLIAAYVWCDDEPAKAEYYMQQYDKRVMLILAAKKDIKPTIMQNKTGW